MTNRIKHFRETAGLTQSQVANALYLSLSGYRKIERGERRLDAKTIGLLSALFDDDGDDIAGTKRDLSPKKDITPVIPSYLRSSEPNIDVHWLNEDIEGKLHIIRDGQMSVPRPFYLWRDAKSFGFQMAGQSMEPVFSPGDILFVDTLFPPMRHKIFLFFHKDEEREQVLLGLLLNWNSETWDVQRYMGGEAEILTLSRYEWPAAMQVVGAFFA